MKILLILEGMGLLYCLYSWIRDHPHTRMEWLVSTGKGIYRLLFRKGKKTGSEFAEWMFPNVSDEERNRLYFSMRIGGILLWILLGNAVFLLAVYTEKPEIFPGIHIQRPAYGEEERNFQYQLSIQEGDKIIAEVVDIQVPEQKPSQEEIEKQFMEAEALLHQRIEELTQDTESLNLPEAYKDIGIEYQSNTREWVGDDGKIYWEHIREEQQAQIQAKLFYEEKEQVVLLEWNMIPKDTGIWNEMDTVKKALKEGVYLTDEALELPTQGENGVQYHWSIPDDNSRIGLGILWILIFPILITYMQGQEQKQKLRIRKERIRQRYPDMLNKLMILMSAGMSITRAWMRITEDYTIQKVKYNQDEPLYEEMIYAGKRLNNGYSMGEVIRVFAQRNSIREIQQFCAILQTGWKRGDAHVLLHLKELHDRSWDIRKRTARKLSEEADTKLLLPLMLMLVVVMIIVLAPAMMTMKM